MVGGDRYLTQFVFERAVCLVFEKNGRRKQVKISDGKGIGGYTSKKAIKEAVSKLSAHLSSDITTKEGRMTNRLAKETLIELSS